jgi:hypothetical protein
MSYEGLTGKITMRACNHQVQTPGFVGIVQKNHAFKGILDFPFLGGDRISIPVERITIPPRDTGNARCK